MLDSSLRLEPLTTAHSLTDFECSHIPSMNEWFKHNALNAHSTRMTRVFVLCGDDKRPLGFFTLSGFCLEVEHLSNRDGNSYKSKTVPAHYLGRIAVDKSLKGEGVGSFLIGAAFKTYAKILDLTTSNFLFLHANSEFLAKYYEQYGFKRSFAALGDGEPIPMYIKSRAILKYLADQKLVN